MAKNFISEQFSAVCRDLTNLSLSYQTTTATVRKVAAVPSYRKRNENEPVNKIVVTEQTGREALEIGSAMLQRSSHQPADYSQKSAVEDAPWGTLVLPRRLGVLTKLRRRLNASTRPKLVSRSSLSRRTPTGQERFSKHFERTAPVS